jgi:signal transduction histidine kinase
MSHEIRTPMNAILGFSELLHATGRFKGTAAWSAFPQWAHLLALSTISWTCRRSSGKLELEYESVSVQRVVEEITRLFSIKAGRKGLLVTDLDSKLPSGLLLDESAVEADTFQRGGQRLEVYRARAGDRPHPVGAAGGG